MLVHVCCLYDYTIVDVLFEKLYGDIQLIVLKTDGSIVFTKVLTFLHHESPLCIHNATRLYMYLSSSALRMRHHHSHPAMKSTTIHENLRLMCMLCISLFVHLSSFFWPLCCLSFFD